MSSASLNVRDNRKGKTYELPIEERAIRVVDLRQIETSPDDLGLLSYNAAFVHTAARGGRITFIGGE
jgi:citrate synthase